LEKVPRRELLKDYQGAFSSCLENNQGPHRTIPPPPSDIPHIQSVCKHEKSSRAKMWQSVTRAWSGGWAVPRAVPQNAPAGRAARACMRWHWTGPSRSMGTSALPRSRRGRRREAAPWPPRARRSASPAPRSASRGGPPETGRPARPRPAQRGAHLRLDGGHRLGPGAVAVGHGEAREHDLACPAWGPAVPGGAPRIFSRVHPQLWICKLS